MSRIDNPEQWRQVRALFERCADLPPERWHDELQAACPSHASVRTEVLAMLQADAAIGSDWPPGYSQPPRLLHALIQAMDAQSNFPSSHQNRRWRRACILAAIVLTILATSTATAFWLGHLRC